MEPYLHEIDCESLLQLSTLVKDPKYERINEVVLQMVN
jgi:hypothetical protein